MRRMFWLAVLLLMPAAFGSAQNSKQGAKETSQKGPCDSAQTQLELNECSAEQFHKADAQLNVVYGKLLKEMQMDLGQTRQNDPEMKNHNEKRIQKLKTAEKAWLQYRDLHCEAAQYEYEGGSMSPMVLSQCMAATTEHRIEELKAAYESN